MEEDQKLRVRLVGRNGRRRYDVNRRANFARRNTSASEKPYRISGLGLMRMSCFSDMACRPAAAALHQEPNCPN